MIVTGQYTKTNHRTRDEPEIIDRVIRGIEIRHYGVRTEEKYVKWIKDLYSLIKETNDCKIGYEKQQALFS